MKWNSLHACFFSFFAIYIKFPWKIHNSKYIFTEFKFVIEFKIYKWYGNLSRLFQLYV